MKGTGSRSEKKHCVVKHAPLPARLRRCLESAGQAAQFVVDEPAVGSEILETIRFARGVRKLVSEFKAYGTTKVVTDANAIFSTKLVGGHAGCVGLEREVNQLIHRTQIVARILRRNIELKMIDVDLRKRDVQPAFGLFHLYFRIAHGLKVLSECILIMF